VTNPAHQVDEEKIKTAYDELRQFLSYQELGIQAKEKIDEIVTIATRPVAIAPTLVRYTKPDTFRIALREYVRDYLAQKPSPGRSEYLSTVKCWVGDVPATQEIAATLVYEHSTLDYSQALEIVKWDHTAFVTGALALRGPHDELPRAFRTGGFIFDIYMDIGGFRDMHRHRRVTQILQQYTADHFTYPFDTPAQYAPHITSAYQHSLLSYNVLNRLALDHEREGLIAPYILPLGARRRMLMKMDLAELVYIAELRTGPAGHISYRRVAWEMFQALSLAAPEIASAISDRVTDPNTPIDFFKR
jgi:hypothetical protein